MHEENHQSHYHHRYNTANKSPIDPFLKVSRCQVVVLNSDGVWGGGDVTNGAHVTGSADKLIAPLEFGHQIYHGPGRIDVNPLANGGYRPSCSARDRETVLDNSQIQFGELDLKTHHGHAATILNLSPTICS
jgi:hypothetical protein